MSSRFLVAMSSILPLRPIISSATEQAGGLRREIAAPKLISVDPICGGFS